MGRPDPIWGVLREQGRYNLVWLARRTGYSHSHVKAIAAGAHRPTARFRAECARVLEMDVADLFHDDGVSHGGTPVGPDAGLDEPADTGLRARLYPDEEEGRIVRIA